MREFAAYGAHGWQLCAIAPGHKSPDYPGWQNAGLPLDALPELEGAGLLHALSGTCALDVDDIALARPWLAERNVPLDELLEAPDAVRIESGRPGRAKLLFRLSKPLRTMKPPKSGLELRCATLKGSSAQDVLPPTLHPDTKKPYRWVYGDPVCGHWSLLPPIPAALARLWRGLVPAASDAPADPPAPSAALAELATLVAARDPDMGYDDWVKVGMALHHESRGSAAGFAVWDSWSAKGKKYKGATDLKAHWMSFGSGPGKVVVTAGALRQESVATPDEFEVVTDAPAEGPTTEDAMRQTVAARKAAAVQLIESRLIYVCQLDKYLDNERGDLLPTDHAIQHRFTHLMPRGRGSRLDPVKILRESPNRTIVDGIAFHPGEQPVFKDGGQSFANTYKPLPVKPEAPTARERDYIEWLFAKIADAEYREWLLKFLGHMVQKPGVKIRSCPLIWSAATGTGKSTLLSTIPRELVGRQYHQEVDYVALEEKFNGYLRDRWVISLKEFKAGTKAERVAIAQRLRPWITDDYISIREMRTDTYTVPNRFVLTATSNESDAAPIDEDDRRWGVYELPSAPITADEVNEIIVGYFNGPRARPTLLHYFQNVSLTGFNAAMRPPNTASRKAMIEASLTHYEETLLEAYEQQAGPFVRECCMVQEVQDYLRQRNVFVPTGHTLGRWMRKHGGVQRQVRDPQQRSFRVWIMRNTAYWEGVTPVQILAHVNGDVVDILE